MNRTRGLRRQISKTLVEFDLVRDQRRARAAVDIVFSEVARIAAEGNVVEIRGFGVFYRRDYPARTAFNPKTRKSVPVPASWKIVFRPGKFLRGRSEL